MRVKKAKALWAVETAWDRSEEYHDPARKEVILCRTRTRLDLWDEHLKDPIAALAKALECIGNSLWCWLLVRSLLLPAFVVAMAFSIACAKILQIMWEGAYWEGVLLCLDPWDIVRLHIIQLLEFLREVWAVHLEGSGEGHEFHSLLLFLPVCFKLYHAD